MLNVIDIWFITSSSVYSPTGVNCYIKILFGTAGILLYQIVWKEHSFRRYSRQGAFKKGIFALAEIVQKKTLVDIIHHHLLKAYIAQTA